MAEVYLAKSDNGLFKIGMSSDSRSRVKGISNQSPVGISLVAAYEHPESEECEMELHRWFREKRVKGEWFSLDIEDVEVFKWYFESMKE